MTSSVGILESFSGQQLTDKQKFVIRYALAERMRRIKSAIGRVREVDVAFEYRDVWKYAASICEMPSYDTVRRYIHKFYEDNPALFTLLTEGDEAVERNLLLKKRNDVSRPNERWQSDARDLPWYVMYNGKPHRVALLIVYDDYSGYIIWWRLILKVEKEDADWIDTPSGKRRRGLRSNKRSRSTTYTALDVLTLYLTAMYRTGVRPERIYTDNGSQFIAAEKYLPLLTRANEPAIQVSHTRPGKPWGRGKVENGLGQVNRLLKRIPGTYNKLNRKIIRDAKHRKDLYSFEEGEAEFAKHFKEINERPRKNAPSRFDVWRSVLSLPAPSIRQMTLAENLISEQTEVTITSWSLYFKGLQWEPKSIEGKNKQIYRRWMDAVAKDEKAWLAAVKLDVGWKVEVRLGDQWIEMVPKITQQADGEHNQDQAATLRDLREERNSIIQHDKEVIHEITGGHLPVAEASSGDYALPVTEPARVEPKQEDKGGPPEGVGNGQSEDSKLKPSAAQATDSTTIAGSQQSDTLPATTNDQTAVNDELAGLPDLDELFQQVDAALEGES